MDSLEDALAKITRALSGQVQEQALISASRSMFESAREMAPVGTGELRNAICQVPSHKARSASVSIEVKGSAGREGLVRQAVMCEFGTSRQMATPFMRPAFEAEKEALVAEFSSTIFTNLKV